MKYENEISNETFADAYKGSMDKRHRGLTLRRNQIATGFTRIGLVVLTLGLTSVAPAASGQAAGHVAPTAAGFNKLLVYMAEPMLEPGEPTVFNDSANFCQIKEGGSDLGLLETLLDRLGFSCNSRVLRT